MAGSETISYAHCKLRGTPWSLEDPKNNEFSHPGTTVKYVPWPLGSKHFLRLALQQHTLFKTREKCTPTLDSGGTELSSVKHLAIPLLAISHFALPAYCTNIPFHPHLSLQCKSVSFVATGNVPLTGNDEEMGQVGSQ